MKISTFSIVCGSNACDAKCPCCVAKMTGPMEPVKTPDWQLFEKACRMAQMNGITTALITGKGEPLLYPYLITEYMIRMQKYEFPFTELQTNGIRIANGDVAATLLPVWKMLGGTLICLSLLHPDPKRNSLAMTGAEDTYNYLDAVQKIHAAGMKVRLNLTLTDLVQPLKETFESLLSTAKEHKVEQLTARDVNMPSDANNEIAKWIQLHKISTPMVTAPMGIRQEATLSGADQLTEYIRLRGGKVAMPLPHGATVYDLAGQNICITTCLTHTQNSEDIRQLIYFPDGRLAYDWTMAGARFL